MDQDEKGKEVASEAWRAVADVLREHGVTVMGDDRAEVLAAAIYGFIVDCGGIADSQAKMPTWNVDVEKTLRVSGTVEVEAKTAREAIDSVRQGIQNRDLYPTHPRIRWQEAVYVQESLIAYGGANLK
jgi:hypothetical protein